jgi:integrase
MKRLLSARTIASLTEPGRYAVGHGCYLQISQWRTKSWIFRYVRDGKARHVGMGSCEYTTLKEARERAFEYRRLLAAGGDPLREKRGAAHERALATVRAKTFEQVAREYIAAHEDTWRGNASRHQWTASLEQHAFPKIGNTPVADIGVGHVLSVLDPIVRVIPETAGRVKHRIAKILDWAHARELRPNDNPARRPNLLPKRKRSSNHFAAMTYTAVPEFMQELRQRPEMSARALELLILTAARPAEVIGARWDEIDLASAMWTLPHQRMKSGRVHRVPLCERAVELLTNLPRVGDYLFPGRFAATPNPNILLFLLHRMGHSVTAHGFRASFRTWASEQTAFPRELIEVALAHVVGDATEQAYARGDMLARRRQLMKSWSDYCSKPDTANGVVVTLRGAS